jgi:hypothetical protein
VLDGVRTLSMMWVILGHIQVFAFDGLAFTNLDYIATKFYSHWPAMVRPRATVGLTRWNLIGRHPAPPATQTRNEGLFRGCKLNKLWSLWQAVTGGFFSVDTFFWLSAFLSTFLLLKGLDKQKPKGASATPRTPARYLAPCHALYVSAYTSLRSNTCIRSPLL